MAASASSFFTLASLLRLDNTSAMFCKVTSASEGCVSVGFATLPGSTEDSNAASLPVSTESGAVGNDCMMEAISECQGSGAPTEIEVFELMHNTGSYGIIRDNMGPYGAIRETCGTTWDHMGPYRAIRDHMIPYGTIRDCMGP